MEKIENKTNEKKENEVKNKTNEIENFNDIILDNSKGYNIELNGEDVKDLIDGTRNDENILARIAIANSINDTADVNWYEGHTKIEGNNIKYLSEDFCDNILIYTIDEQRRNY